MLKLLLLLLLLLLLQKHLLVRCERSLMGHMLLLRLFMRLTMLLHLLLLRLCSQ